MLVHALTEIAKASASVGFEVVVVHAIDEEAVTFYVRYGFTRYMDPEPRIIPQLAALFRKYGAESAVEERRDDSVSR